MSNYSFNFRTAYKPVPKKESVYALKLYEMKGHQSANQNSVVIIIKVG